MSSVLTNKKYSGYIWHFIFAVPFVGISLLFIEFTKGINWYLISTALRIVFGVAILFVSTKLFEKKTSEIVSFRNTKGALLAGTGFLVYFLYYIILVTSGFGRITGLTVGVFLSKILLQQISTGFYEELNYRFLLLEGMKYSKNNTGIRIVLVLVSSILFGLLHCVTGWNTYTFLQTGAIGFAFAVIFVKSGNILIPMILHFIYDVFAKTAVYIEWNHTAVFDGLSSVFEIMLAVMFVLSCIILIVPERKS